MKMILAVVSAGLCALAVARAGEPPAAHRELTDAERARMEERANAAWSKLPVREKLQLLRWQRALREMPPGERRFIHERIERFLKMTPEERTRLQQNRERWAKMTPEEREQAREQFRRRRHELEERWRRAHPESEPPPPVEPQPEPKKETP